MKNIDIMKKKYYIIGTILAVIGYSVLIVSFIMFGYFSKKSVMNDGDFTNYITVFFVLFPIGGLLGAIGTFIIIKGKSIRYNNTINRFFNKYNNVCPNCNNYIEYNMLFCPKCGKELKKECMLCGTFNDNSNDYCTKCGNKL